MLNKYLKHLIYIASQTINKRERHEHCSIHSKIRHPVAENEAAETQMNFAKKVAHVFQKVKYQ